MGKNGNAPSNTHIELGRRFHELTDEERANPEDLAALRAWGIEQGLLWPELLESERVIILSEAGSGKTSELKEQARRLTAEGKAAFFFPVEDLQSQNVCDLLAMEPRKLGRFEAWLVEDGEIGWFFLDAVDELKLTQGKLHIALGRLAQALGIARARARVALTCRPSDWRPIQDLEELLRLLPTSDPETKVLPSGADPFLTPVDEPSSPPPDDETKPAKLRIVAMLPLDEKQIRQFATARGVSDPEALLDEIQRSDSLVFARRPLDLARIISFWIANGRIGTRLEQHEDDVAQGLKENPSRQAGTQLTAEKAREGAERIALALLLTRKRTIRVQERSLQQPNDRQMLDASDALTDWSDSEVAALLRLPIFDPATYGRVRFHHRSIQEYLAAHRLRKLLAAGLPRRELDHILFPGNYGEPVVVPSMRPVAAWLALWDEGTRNELMTREPETLIQRGDPASLPLEARALLLNAFVSSYGTKEWLGVDLPIAEVRRLAHPDLADSILKSWEEGGQSGEVQELLLKMIWQGKICDCASMAFSAAMDTSIEAHNRTLAVRAVEACSRHDLLTALANDVLGHPERWPDRVVFYASGSLFPSALSVADLVALIRRTPEPRNTVGGFQWTLFRDIAPRLDPCSTPTSELRDALTGLVWEGRGHENKPRRAKTSFFHLTAALGYICLSQIRAGINDNALLRAATIAVRFHAQEVIGREEIGQLKAELRRRPGWRERIFAIELALVRELGQRATGHGLFFAVTYEGVLGGLEATDWPWLVGMLNRSRDAAARSALIEAATRVWYARGKDVADRAKLIAAVADDESLADMVAKKADPSPPMPQPEDEEYRREQLQWEIDRKRRRRAIRRSWNQYKYRLLKDPAAAFTGKRRDRLLAPAIQWLGFSEESRHTLARPNWKRFREVLGNAVGGAFEEAAKAYWRDIAPPIVSARPPDEVNLLYHSTEIALTGLAIESTSPSWEHLLTPDEVERATGWATLEMNGFPEWLSTVAAIQPVVVRRVLEKEIRWELGGDASRQHPSVVSAIEYGCDEFKTLLAPVMRDILVHWPACPTDDPERAHNVRNAQRVIRILHETPAFDAQLAEIMAARFATDPTSTLAPTWLLGVFAYSLKRGLELLDAVFSTLGQSKLAEYGPVWFANLFGERDSARIPVEIHGPAQVILGLIRYGYRSVRREDDVHHEGTYSPGLRDDAQRARSNLLSALMDRPGEDSYLALVELADDPLMAHIADRVRLRARERAAIDAEPRPLSDSEFAQWEREHVRVPRDRDELFQTMLDRLKDIEHDTLHSDFNDRETLSDITEEKMMQPRFAAKFAERSRGHYQVVREDEVADKKEPDIRLVATHFDGKAAIELKIGDRWSVRELKDAIITQLLGQYLRHDSCTAGCLLVTYAGRKGFEHPDSGVSMTFEAVITHLQRVARDTEQGERGRVRLAVYGLDLRPPLAKDVQAGSVPKMSEESTLA